MSHAVLVGADGTESFVRRTLGIGVERHDYGQSAFVTTLTLDKPLDGTAYERFTDSGPVALLPLGANGAGLVLSVPAGDAPNIGALDDGASSHSCTNVSAGAPDGFRVRVARKPFRLRVRSRRARPRSARRSSAMPRRPSIRSARRVSISVFATR